MSKDIQMYLNFTYTYIRFNNIVIRNDSCSFLLHIKYRKTRYITKTSVSSKYRVAPESIKSNDNDTLN